jgi:O-acetyl-ADP-ribose deacetylase (regulator of RNase III)
MRNKSINYVIGDATYPIGNDRKIIAHICNNENKWGRGFVLAVSKRWKQPEIEYRASPNHILGNVQFVKVSDDITVANMIAQHGIISEKNRRPISYAALRICLSEVNDKAFKLNATIHMPRIGTGLAGGDWNIIEQIIKDVMSVNVIVYDLM